MTVLTRCSHLANVVYMSNYCCAEVQLHVSGIDTLSAQLTQRGVVAVCALCFLLALPPVVAGSFAFGTAVRALFLLARPEVLPYPLALGTAVSALFLLLAQPKALPRSFALCTAVPGSSVQHIKT